MPRNLRKRGGERGSVLIMAIMVIVVMILIAIPFLFRLSGASRSTERSARALTAFELAEAGVEKVMWFLNPKAGPTGTDPEAIQWDLTGADDVGVIHNMKAADNTVMGDVHVVLTQPVGAALDMRTLTSTGMVRFLAANTVNRTVRVALQKGLKGAFDYGFFANKYFYIQNGFYLDAYDSRDGAYGASLPGGGTNSQSPDVYFGSNTYMDARNPNQPGEATWVIEQGGGSNQVYGTVQAGGYDSQAYNNGTGDPPDPDLLNNVINTPNNVTVDRQVMKQEFMLPPVDVYNLPPKENLTDLIPSSLGNWFNGYNSTTPESSTGYYSERLNRAPLATDLQSGYVKGTFSGSGTLTEANSGFYTSFMVGGYATPGTITIPSGNHVVIYVSSYGDAAKAGSFYMGKDSSINIAQDASLTLILGNTSVTVEQGYNINTQGNPPIPGDCVILGTNQFAVPPNAKLPLQPGTKATDVDKMAIPGFMFFEHAQSDGNIYAALYAPKATMADLQGQNHMNFYGSAVVDQMCFKVQVSFHYDKALANLDLINAGFEYWTIINWTEVVGAGN